MERKFLHVLITFMWITSLIFGPTATVFAHNSDAGTSHAIPTESLFSTQNSTTLADPDFDGISTADEEAGWYNDKGGPYFTSPTNPDSDGDGLTDGQEQLYDTDPTSEQSPGIYVEYEDEYQTKKYYPWRQHGSRFISHAEITPSSERDVIVRRGTTFYVGGPVGAELDIDERGSLTNLQVLNNSCGGGWTIRVPEDGTVGRYTLTVEKGNWSKSLTVYVILELEGPSQEYVDSVNAHYNDGDDSTAQDYIDVLLYNDDREDERDTITFYVDTSYESKDPGFDPYNHAVYGWAIGWRTDYHKRYVFEDYLMPTVNGYSDRWSIANIVKSKVNNNNGDSFYGDGNFDLLDFNVTSWPNSTYNVLYNAAYDRQGDCNSHASMLTTFLRGVGIMARPVGVEWRGLPDRARHYDYSTEVWLDGRWRVARAYTREGYQSRSWWGSNVYFSGNGRSPCHACGDLMLTVGPSWEWDEVNINYETALPSDDGYYRDYLTGRYESRNPPEYPYGNGSEIKRWEWIKTPVQDFWNSAPPVVTDDCSDCGYRTPGWDYGADPQFDTLTPVTTDETTETQTDAGPVRFGDVLADRGVDLDNDGLYDELVVDFQVEVDEPGTYLIDGLLDDTNPETRLGGQVDAIAWAKNELYLEAGTQTVSLVFKGTDISVKEAAGPYVIRDLRVTDNLEASPEDYNTDLIDIVSPDYIITNYDWSSFDDWGATLTGQYTHQAQDTNGDGYLDSLIVNTGLNISENDTYRIEAELYDNDDEYVASATWTGSDSNAALQFDAALSKTTPYHIRNVSLFRGEQIIDDVPYNAYSTDSLYNVGLEAQSEEVMQVVGAVPNDTDNDGDYDTLDFKINKLLLADGQYHIEAWLENSTGGLIAWESQDVELTAGLHQFTLPFDGQAINAFKVNGPYKLVALKLSLGDELLEEIHVAYETGEFSFTEFDSAEGGNVVLMDGVEESNGAVWNLAESQWQVTQEASHTPSHAWTDSPASQYSSDSTTWLTSNPVNISGNSSALPLVAFQSCHAIADDDVGKVQVRVNETGDWTDLETFTGASQGWNLEQVIPYNALGANNFEFRFELATNNSNQDDGWYIDDVVVKVSDDLDEDGIPNDEDGVEDTDGDGNPDLNDDDADNDGLKDNEEGQEDTDGDGVPDFKDVDSDGDGLNDDVEGDSDTDGDGVPDFKDVDSDGDGLNDDVEGDTDSDGDGIPDFKDLDSDNDGILDEDEGDGDTDGDGLSDSKDTDSDGDGISDEDEWGGSGDLLDHCTNDAGLDTDEDGIPNCEDDDVDGDGIPNYLDDDSDGDGINDNNESGPDQDSDGDGIPDYLDSEDFVENLGPIYRSIYLPFITK